MGGIELAVTAVKYTSMVLSSPPYVRKQQRCSKEARFFHLCFPCAFRVSVHLTVVYSVGRILGARAFSCRLSFVCKYSQRSNFDFNLARNSRFRVTGTYVHPVCPPCPARKYIRYVKREECAIITQLSYRLFQSQIKDTASKLCAKSPPHSAP